jgi:LysR family hydrogen peroxide-inducible transcriptional activator
MKTSLVGNYHRINYTNVKIMTLIQLEYIIALNKYRHFVTAAEKCFVTQPTLSMQIQKLEDELGVIIFDRSRQPVEPTPLGEKIISQAKVIVEAAKKIPEMIEEIKGEVKGELKIGIIPTIAPYLVPLFITQTLNEYPELQVQIEELMTEQVVQKLNDNELDMGIIATPLQETGIREIPLYYEPFLVYASEKHQLYAQQSIHPADLSINDIWLLNEGHCFSSHSINLCGVNEVYTQSLALNYRSGSLESLIKLVEQQYGYTLLPYLAMLDMDKRRKEMVRHFAEPIPCREISIVVKETFLKEQTIKLIKSKITENVPQDLLKLGEGMLVSWK